MKALLGTPCSSVWSIVVEREDLLDVVAELVDGDVVALVVHAVGVDARPQVRLVVAHARAQRVAGAARRIDGDAVGEEAGALGREAEAGEDARQVLGEGLRGRVALARLRVERRLADAGARLEAVVPDVVRLERALQPGADQRRDARADRGLEHRAQQLLDLGRRDLALDLELAMR